MYLINISKTDSISAAAVRRFCADSGDVVIWAQIGEYRVKFGREPEAIEFARLEYLRLRAWMCGGYCEQPVFEFGEMPKSGPDSHVEVVQ